jgi:membrane-bound lytic murein transglycosylase B
VPFGYEQTRELQQLMVRRGLYKGEVDGKLGAATRGSVKLAQKTYGLPADSYPTRELLVRLRRPQ